MIKMMDTAELEKLARLARIAMSPEESQGFRADFNAILKYVSQIQTVSDAAQTERGSGALRNVMREDGEPHESGVYTDILLHEAPEKENNFVKVKKILP